MAILRTITGQVGDCHCRLPLTRSSFRGALKTWCRLTQRTSSCCSRKITSSAIML
jgi:hypothetical protein